MTRYRCRIVAKYGDHPRETMSRMQLLLLNDYLKKTVKVLPSETAFKNPFPMGYKPDLDVTEELGPEMISRYLQLIGICRWAVELG